MTPSCVPAKLPAVFAMRTWSSGHLEAVLVHQGTRTRSMRAGRGLEHHVENDTTFDSTRREDRRSSRWCAGRDECDAFAGQGRRRLGSRRRRYALAVVLAAQGVLDAPAMYRIVSCRRTDRRRPRTAHALAAASSHSPATAGVPAQVDPYTSGRSCRRRCSPTRTSRVDAVVQVPGIRAVIAARVVVRRDHAPVRSASTEEAQLPSSWQPV